MTPLLWHVVIGACIGLVIVALFWWVVYKLDLF